MGATTAQGTPRRRRGSLGVDEIVVVATQMLEDDGVAAFSMRKLATRLGVNPMTVYLRFDSKETLLDAVVADALDQQAIPPGEGPLADQLVQWTASVRQNLLQARALLPLLRTSRHLAAPMIAAGEAGLSLLAGAGLEKPAAVDAFRMLFWHAVGSALAHEAMTSHAPEVLAERISFLDDAPALDPEELFERSTRALVASLEIEP